MKITEEVKNTKDLKKYADYLFQKELSEGTIKIYVKQAELLLDYLKCREITKDEIIKYKKYLLAKERKITTTNLYIVAVNSYLKYAGYESCTIKTKKVQKNRCLENVIDMEEYQKILDYTLDSGRIKYYYIMRVLAFTGIRISELSFLTVEAIYAGKFTVANKGKIREVYLPEMLINELKAYCKKEGIASGVVFYGTAQKPISRIAVYKMFTQLADKAGVKKEKAHPHSFRHLFAVTYMGKYSNLPELADILGHSSLETTRIYTATSAEERRRKLNGLNF